jgi:phosphatidylglycerophosphatase A
MWRKWVATFGGAGLLPAMPGTFASLAAAGIFLALWSYFHDNTRIVVVALAALISWAARAVYPWAREYFHSDDPRQCVLDEVVGQWLTLLLAPLGSHPLSSVAAGFFLFRAFDVAKPFPINRLDRMKGFTGFYFDDVAAGVYAGLVLWLLIYASSWLFGTPTPMAFTQQ